MITRILLLLLAAASLMAQPLANPVNFSLDPYKKLDSAFIPTAHAAGMAGADGRISVKDGHFAYADGSRARFFGTIILGEACFPDSAQAVQLAEKLRSLGYNIVRLKQFDYSYSNGQSILQNSSTGSSNGLDSAQIRKFDWLVYQLKKNGIYLSMCLHSTRQARRNDGVARWDTLPSNGIIVNYIDPAMQQQYKQFVSLLLNHFNPFTRTRYKDEPAIAWFDLDEGNSMIAHWINNWLHHRSEGGSTNVNLSYYHSRMIDTLWVRWLLKKYGNEAGIRAAWTFTPNVTTNIISKNNGFEDAFDNSWTFTFSNNAVAIAERDPVDKKEGSYSMRVRIGNTGTAANNILYYNVLPQVQRYARYEIRFWARTDVSKRLATFSIANFAIRDTLTQQWKEYVYHFRSNLTGGTRFYLQAGGVAGDVWLDDVRIKALVETPFEVGDFVNQFKIRRIKYNTPSFTPTTFPEYVTMPHKRWMDNMLFYQDVMQQFNTQFKTYINDSLKCNALVGSQNSVSLLNDIYVQRGMDFTEVATSYDSRRRIPGSPSDTMWYFLNDAAVSSRSGGIINNFARAKIKGMPFVLNAHAMPYPYTNLQEMLTMMPAYLAYQDADAYFVNYYAGSKGALTTNFVGKNLHYETSGNPSLQGYAPFAAYSFIKGLIHPANDAMPLHQTQEALQFPIFGQAGGGGFFVEASTDARMPLFRRMEIDSFTAVLQSYRPHLEIPPLADPNGVVDTRNLLSDTKELLWNGDDSLLTIDAPQYKFVNGVLKGKIMSLAGDAISIERSDDGKFGTIAMLSTDSTLLESKRFLISMNSRACNASAQWGGDSTVYQNWGGTQMQMEAMKANFSIRNEYDSLVITPLDSLGRPVYAGRQFIGKTGNRLRFLLYQAAPMTLWYMVEQISKENSTSGVEGEAASTTLPHLYAPAPNIISDVVSYECDLPSTGVASRISLCGTDGRSMTLWEGQALGQTVHNYADVRHLPQGVYILSAQCGEVTARQSVLIIR